MRCKARIRFHYNLAEGGQEIWPVQCTNMLVVLILRALTREINNLYVSMDVMQLTQTNRPWQNDMGMHVLT
jgi:hypothetical protein